MNQHSDLAGDEPGVAGSGQAGRQRWRTIVAVVLIVVGCVLAPLAGVAVWARNQVTNTDRYVRTVAPLASDPAIQRAVADQITAQIFTYLDVQGLTNQTVDALAERGLRPRAADQLRGLAGPLASGIQGFVRTEVGKIVQSQAFADAWVQANRVAHQALVKTLTGQGDGAVTVQGDTVTLNLAPFIETVKARLVEGGFDLAARIPEVNASFVLFDVKNLTRARSAFNLYDTVVAYLRLGLRTILVLALVIAAGAFLTGQSTTALRTRQRLAAGIGWLRGGAEHAGLRTGPVGTWVYTNKKVLRIAAVTLAALALAFWGQPTGKTILVLAGLLLAALALIEFLGQPPERTAEITTQT